MTNAIDVKELYFAYKTTPVLVDVSFSVNSGAFIGIIGPNGGGKTTLLKLLMGLYLPQKGSIHLLGDIPGKMRAHIGYVPQGNTLDLSFPISVKEFVLLGSVSTYRTFSGYPKKVQKRAMEALEMMKLIPYAQKAFGQLSGGLLQRLFIARAIASDPAFLFLDEPIANLDPDTSTEILENLQALKGKKTIIMVTHSLSATVQFFDQVLSVEKKVTTYSPDSICAHFTKGLYHTPLLKKKNEGPI